jgi:hypothetical protein
MWAKCFRRHFAVIPGVGLGFGSWVLLKKFVVSREVFLFSNVEYLLDQNIQKNFIYTRNLNAH